MEIKNRQQTLAIAAIAAVALLASDRLIFSPLRTIGRRGPSASRN